MSIPAFRTAAGSGLMRAARAAAHSLAQEVAVWRASRALSVLDDHGLHDIGVARGDIEAAVRQGRAALRN